MDRKGIVIGISKGMTLLNIKKNLENDVIVAKSIVREYGLVKPSDKTYTAGAIAMVAETIRKTRKECEKECFKKFMEDADKVTDIQHTDYNKMWEPGWKYKAWFSDRELKRMQIVSKEEERNRIREDVSKLEIVDYDEADGITMLNRDDVIRVLDSNKVGKK